MYHAWKFNLRSPIDFKEIGNCPETKSVSEWLPTECIEMGKSTNDALNVQNYHFLHKVLWFKIAHAFSVDQGMPNCENLVAGMLVMWKKVLGLGYLKENM